MHEHWRRMVRLRYGHLSCEWHSWLICKASGRWETIYEAGGVAWILSLLVISRRRLRNSMRRTARVTRVCRIFVFVQLRECHGEVTKLHGSDTRIENGGCVAARPSGRYLNGVIKIVVAGSGTSIWKRRVSPSTIELCWGCKFCSSPFKASALSTRSFVNFLTLSLSYCCKQLVGGVMLRQGARSVNHSMICIPRMARA